MIVVELLDCDLRARRCLLLRLDDLVGLAQLGVEPRQRHVLLLKAAHSLVILGLSDEL